MSKEEFDRLSTKQQYINDLDKWGRNPEQRQQKVMDDYNKKQAEMAAAKKARQQAALPLWQRDVYADYVPDSVSDTLDSLSGYSKLKPVSDYTNPESGVVNVGDYALDNLGSATADSFGYGFGTVVNAAAEFNIPTAIAKETYTNITNGDVEKLREQTVGVMKKQGEKSYRAIIDEGVKRYSGSKTKMVWNGFKWVEKQKKNVDKTNQNIEKLNKGLPND